MIIAKKSLGQNFLIDQEIIDEITNVVEIENKNILEIGPGTGNLTTAILNKKPKKLIVVEKDNELASLLEKKFTIKIKIINKDILRIDESFLDNERLTVFGNLPYNISTEILSKWILNLDNKNLWFDYLILMFQKEVAHRIISKYNSNNNLIENYWYIRYGNDLIRKVIYKHNSNNSLIEKYYYIYNDSNEEILSEKNIFEYYD